MPTIYPAEFIDQSGTERYLGSLEFTSDANQPQIQNPIASGALPTTTAFSSGTGKQILTTRDVTLCVPLTFDASAADATCTVAISPDNSTYSTLGIETIPTATNPVNGEIHVLILRVPAGWYVKLTASHVTFGTGTYY